MGTRSLTLVFDDRFEKGGHPFLNMYRQYDGYPKGHGDELAAFLQEFTVVQGLPVGEKQVKPARSANGMSCLAGQLVAHFKTEPGNIYLEHPTARDMGEEYIYEVRPFTDPEASGSANIKLRVLAGSVTFFGMPGTKQDNMIELFNGPVGDWDADAAEKYWRFRMDNDPPPNDFTDSMTKGSDNVTA